MMLDLTHNRIQVYEDGALKLNITTSHGDISLLEGKYSESFVTELAKQITDRVSSTLGVLGFADSTIEVDMVFSPESFMEHTSDGVTYRRLLISAKGCAARDFWIKWRGFSGAPLSCASDVTSSDIEFSIGEDVPHKVREREYRYLVHGNSDKYRTAMGKKNITEWRELIKRAVKRGELIKTAPDEEISQHSEVVADKLADLLERFNINLPKESVEEQEKTDDIAELAKAKLMARGIADESESDTDSEPSELPFFPSEEQIEENSDEDFVGDFISSLEISAPEQAPAEAPIFFMQDEEDEEDATIEIPSCDIPLYDSEEAEPDESKTAHSPVCVAPQSTVSSDSDILRVRLNEEALARSEAEEKVTALTAERDALLIELENMKSALVAVKETLGNALKEVTAERDALKSELELEASARQREKALFAEAARQAKEESDRLVREREDEIQRIAAEEARLAEEKIREEEKARQDEIRRLEVERIERDIRSRDDGKREALERAQELSRAMEREAMLKVQSIGFTEPKPAQPVYTAPVAPAVQEPTVAEPAKPAPIGPENHPYTSVSAKLIFRHNVDPNVKGRLYEIISRALEYYKKEHVYIKLKASIPEPAAVLLNFEQFPEGEDELLRGIVKLIGNSDLGVMKIIVE